MIRLDEMGIFSILTNIDNAIMLRNHKPCCQVQKISRFKILTEILPIFQVLYTKPVVSTTLGCRRVVPVWTHSSAGSCLELPRSSLASSVLPRPLLREQVAAE